MRRHELTTVVALCVAIGGLLLVAGSCNDTATAVPSRASTARTAPDTGAPPDTGVPPNAKQIVHVNAAGDGAGVWSGGTTLDGGYFYFSVYFTRTDRAEIWLSVDYQVCDASYNCRWEGGYGTIPAGDVQGNGDNHLSLRTNLAAENPDFYRWVSDSGAFAVNEIAADWHKVGDDYTISKGVTKQVAPWGGMHSSGTSRSGSAVVTMSVPGTPLDAWTGPGYLNSDHQSITYWYVY